MPNEMDQNGGDTKKGVDESNSLNASQNRFLREKMESTLRKAREKVAEVQQDVGSDRFDKAWERVYGNKQYRPSWIGKLQNRGSPPTKFKHHARNKKQGVITEDKKEEEDETLGPQTEGIPEEFRAKKTLDPLKIKGKIVPNEQALDKWRKEIDTGDVTNNKIVKQTNVTGWIDNNQYWKPDEKNFMSMKPIKKKMDSQKVPENQKINTEKYDLVGKYENRVQKADLKIGDKIVPKERDLKKWGDELEIPKNLTKQDFSVKPSKKPATTTLSGAGAAAVAGGVASATPGKETEGQKKWDKVLKTADVPNFLANGYW
nr:uncharacterized protein LOC129273170 [Lytechinus pictus]